MLVLIVTNFTVFGGSRDEPSTIPTYDSKITDSTVRLRDQR